MKNATTPSLVRIRRVDYFLKREAKYVSKEVENFVKGTESIPFPKSTLTVAQAIHTAGLDSCAMDKDAIYTWANHILFNGPLPKAVAATPTANTETKAVAEEADTDVTDQAVATINVPVRVAIYTLLVSARELVNLDRKPGAEELSKYIDTAACQYLNALNQPEKAYLNGEPQVEQVAKTPVVEPKQAEPAAVQVTPAVQTSAQVPTPA